MKIQFMEKNNLLGDSSVHDSKMKDKSVQEEHFLH